LLSSGIIMLVFNGTYLLAFCLGAVKIGEGLITYGTMTAFLSLVGQIQSPVYNAATILTETMSILASMDRIIPVAKLEREDGQDDVASENMFAADFSTRKTENGAVNGTATKNANVTGAGCYVQKADVKMKPLGLVADRLTLSYGDSPVVDQVSFAVKPGEAVMLSGSSGIGKTTLIRGILGFLRPEGGRLMLTTVGADGNADGALAGSHAIGIDCSAATRRMISYVPQGNTIFSGTVAENLRMGKSDATEEEMYAALEAACALDFVKNMPEGLNTMLGERATGISEGQAQRLSIARAFLKPAGLIILDEATASLDEETEKKILEGFFAREDHPTCIFVSHRSGLRRYADRIIRVKTEAAGAEADT
ncbi:MAG: ABC transporter ATP-binding protein, partial [Parasporobacterium sp.]|nr:ABC transporter ATP-binding protein [Parasporobacterium sp.]